MHNIDMTSPQGLNSISANGLPRGELLGRYTSYLDAQKLVDYLADNNFPVASVTIVGNDVRTVERVTAKLSYPRVALAGAAQGAMFGFFVGLVMMLFSGGTGGVYQILSSMGLGMAIWMIFGVVTYSTRRGKRDFASSSQFVATSFDVVVDFEHAQSARALAAKLPMRPSQPAAAPMQQPAQPTAAPAPAQPQSQGQPQAPASEPAKDPRNGQFPDLPDGRPRYGVRVQNETPAEPQKPAAAPEQNLAEVEPTVASQPAPAAQGEEPAEQPAKDQQEPEQKNS